MNTLWLLDFSEKKINNRYIRCYRWCSFNFAQFWVNNYQFIIWILNGSKTIYTYIQSNQMFHPIIIIFSLYILLFRGFICSYSMCEICNWMNVRNDGNIMMKTKVLILWIIVKLLGIIDRENVQDITLFSTKLTNICNSMNEHINIQKRSVHKRKIYWHIVDWPEIPQITISNCT